MTAERAAGRLAGAELRAMLHLRALPGIGDVRLRALLRRHGSARAALRASAAQLGEKAARARDSPGVRGRIDRALETIDALGIDVVGERDSRYPAPFRHLHDPPCVLFARGRLELLDRPAVAVVGSRRHTPYGAGAARRLAAGLARAGVVVVSGMARGIDGHAHEAALATGRTIGVLGCGIDVVYPRRHDALQEQVAEEGLLVSEFLPGEPALPHNFPRRNRLIAALALGVLVVEASRKSGALITVDHALDLGRDVFAVPGPIGRETSAGTHALLRDGARIVTGVADVLEELRLTGPATGTGAAARAGSGSGGGGGADANAAADANTGAAGGARDGEIGGADGADEGVGEDRAAGGVAGRHAGAEPAADGGTAPPGLSEGQLSLWRALELEPHHVDELARRCRLPVADALSALLELEIRGHARQVAGARFVRDALATA